MNNYVYINGRKTELTEEMIDAIKKIQLDACSEDIDAEQRHDNQRRLRQRLNAKYIAPQYWL